MCGQWMDVEAASGSEKRESAAPSSPISGGDTEGSASVLDVSNKAKEGRSVIRDEGSAPSSPLSANTPIKTNPTSASKALERWRHFGASKCQRTPPPPHCTTCAHYTGGVVTPFKTLLRCSHRTPTTALATRLSAFRKLVVLENTVVLLTDRMVLAETQMARWSLRLAFPLLRKAHQ